MEAGPRSVQLLYRAVRRCSDTNGQHRPVVDMHTFGIFKLEKKRRERRNNVNPFASIRESTLTYITYLDDLAKGENRSAMRTCVAYHVTSARLSWTNKADSAIMWPHTISAARKNVCTGPFHGSGDKK